MAKITYTDKVSTEVDPTIPEINKITDANMNEIKSVVNDNYDYSIYIGEEADATSDTKLLIETDTLASLGTEITNTYSTSQVLGYSANYVNNLNTYSTTEQRIGTYLGKPLYRKVVTGVINASSTSGTFQDTYITIDNSIEDFVDITTKGVINTLSKPVFIPYTFQDVNLRIYINTFTQGAIMYSNNSTYSVNVTITALYTKTTD